MRATASTDPPFHQREVPAAANGDECEGAALSPGPSARAARPVATRSGAERVLELARIVAERMLPVRVADE
jgi:hypothetical protein